MMHLNEGVLNHIELSLVAHRAVVIGVNGLDCAGKTTYARELVQYLNLHGLEPKLLHVDDYNENDFQARFYQAFIEGGIAAVDLDLYYDKSIDYARMERDIKSNISLERPLIVEGVFLYKFPLVELFSLKIFLNIETSKATERYSKRRQKENDERPLEVMTDIWIPSFERYCQECLPQQSADIIADSSSNY